MEANRHFPEIRGNFGFGCMRLPMRDGWVNYDEFNAMIDAFLAAGFNYFDTAHGYIDGKSEIALRECLTWRVPRENYILTNKLSGDFFHSEQDIRPLFEHQLAQCGVDYFDFYLMHAQNRNNYDQFNACRAYETALALKAEGRIRHVGISFHDTAELLERILTEHPQVEVVQIQLNYADFDDPAVQSRRLLEVCERHNKPVLVMEPVKGGHLVNLPQQAKDVLDGLNGGSYASYALRFAAGFERVAVVLSGMSDWGQMNDNLSTMKDFRPLDEREQNAVAQVNDVFRSLGLVQCTGCRYCTAGCPQSIAIPDIFTCMNTRKVFNEWNPGFYYHNVLTVRPGTKASDCVRCGQCESACPQHLPIRDLLAQAAGTFEH